MNNLKSVPPMNPVIQPGLLTFGQLLRLKRERMGLSQIEVIKRTQITNLPNYEKDASVPRDKAIKQLKEFYRLTEEEINSCKTRNIVEAVKGNLHKRYEIRPVEGKVREVLKLNPKETSKASEVSKNRISALQEMLGMVLQDISKLECKGDLATKIRESALKNLGQAHRLIYDVAIVERLI